MKQLRQIAGLVLCVAAPAATTTYWELNSYADFVKGRLEGTSLARDGRLRLAPKAETLFTAEQPVIWSMARGLRGTVYLATGHLGQVYRVDGAGKSELVWTAPEPEVFAIAVDGKGVLYAGTSPDGKVYRIEAGKAVEYFAPQTRYIWSLAIAADGSLYVGTGDGGKIFRVTAAGTGEVWYESGQSHVTALALDGQGRLLAGTEPNGILYRVTGKEKAFVLYDASLPEIRAIVPTADGGMYVAALGGAFGTKPAGAAGAVSAIGAGAVVATTPTSITVEAAQQAQAGIEIKPQAQQAKTASTPAVSSSIVSTPIVDLTGVEKAALYRIQADNMVETLWSSKEENIYDIAPSGQSVLFSTDGQGRVYRLEADRKATLLVETREGEATRLLPTPEGVLAATSHAGKLLRIGTAPADAGSFESPVHDASSTARWGRIRFVGDVPQGTKLVLRTRSGNAAKPDATWSEWSEPMAASDTVIASPNARYIQWKAEFTGAGGRTPELDQVTIAYLPQNTAPVVKSVTVASQAAAAAVAKAASGPASPNSVYTVTVSDSGDAGTSAAGTPSQTVSRPQSGQLVITWQAEDADGDRLAYAIAFRGEEEREWKTLKTNWTELALTLEGDAFADGRYRFRVVASDAVSNPAAQAREGEMVSAPVLIDNTPPLVKTVTRRSGAGIEIEATAEDGASVVKRAEYSLDAGPFFPLSVEDGVADSLVERFRARLENVAAGEHLLVIRGFDSAGNSGVAKVVLR
ncbi:MAG: hypothetical protein JNK48_07400 [Bryobacterales bacterium]|nr:hypothetical protein [Bryobacterales bacterium]